MISPFLLKAVSELDKLVKLHQYENRNSAKVADIRTDLLAEMNELAKLIRQAQCDDKAVIAKLVSVRRHIEAL